MGGAGRVRGAIHPGVRGRSIRTGEGPGKGQPGRRNPVRQMPNAVLRINHLTMCVCVRECVRASVGCVRSAGNDARICERPRACLLRRGRDVRDPAADVAVEVRLCARGPPGVGAGNSSALKVAARDRDVFVRRECVSTCVRMCSRARARERGRARKRARERERETAIHAHAFVRPGCREEPWNKLSVTGSRRGGGGG